MNEKSRPQSSNKDTGDNYDKIDWSDTSIEEPNVVKDHSDSFLRMKQKEAEWARATYFAVDPDNDKRDVVSMKKYVEEEEDE